ncbi:MAG: rhodanese-like domain-containing protein [Pseudomonadota bacterium]
MAATITATELHARLHGPDAGEVALLDVRELGQIAEGHILFSAPLPYSRLELGLPDLVPNRRVPLILLDAGDGVAARAAVRAQSMGYHDISMLDGGVAAWQAAGYELFDGVNVPSKVFGELIELDQHTPRLSASDLQARRDAGEKLVVVDGRPLDEYRRMNIPGATCCPNGELALRIDSLVPDADTTVVINCAGRTRSIIGAQTLIDLGLPNPVYALENGTQGWELAGLTLHRGTEGSLPLPAAAEARRDTALALAEQHGVARIDRATLEAWLRDIDRTLYLFDIRTSAERADDDDDVAELLAHQRVVHAPGGQLVQATDRWVGVRRARIVVMDTEGVRAPVVAAWLSRLGHNAAVVDGGISALAGLPTRPAPVAPNIPPLARINLTALTNGPLRQTATIIDLRNSADYRGAHIPGAKWSTRARITEVAGSRHNLLVAQDPKVAELAAIDLREAGVTELGYLDVGMGRWRAAGHPVTESPSDPPDADRIDFIFHTHDRHQGNLDAARAYLSWEVALIDRLSPEERAVFRI